MSIQDALNAKKAAVINVKIAYKLTASKFIVFDKVDIARLLIPKGVSVSFGKGDFIKIIKPTVVNNELVLNDRLKYLKGSKFEEIEDSELVQNLVTDWAGEDQTKTLKAMENKTKGDVVENLGLKVCSVSKEFTGSYSNYRACGLKDQHGRKVVASLYSPYCNEVKQGVVYKFSKFKISGYKGDSEDYIRLNSVAGMKIEEIPGPAFDHVFIGDGRFWGSVIGKRQSIWSLLSCYSSVCFEIWTTRYLLQPLDQ